VTRRLEATVRGRVQGVGYRWFIVREAARLDVNGWAANEPDGSVRVVAEGPDEALAELLDVLREGPPGADVRDVGHVLSSSTGEYDGFRIRPGGHRGD